MHLRNHASLLAYDPFFTRLACCSSERQLPHRREKRYRSRAQRSRSATKQRDRTRSARCRYSIRRRSVADTDQHRRRRSRSRSLSILEQTACRSHQSAHCTVEPRITCSSRSYRQDANKQASSAEWIITTRSFSNGAVSHQNRLQRQALGASSGSVESSCTSMENVRAEVSAAVKLHPRRPMEKLSSQAASEIKLQFHEKAQLSSCILAGSSMKNVRVQEADEAAEREEEQDQMDREKEVTETDNAVQEAASKKAEEEEAAAKEKIKEEAEAAQKDPERYEATDVQTPSAEDGSRQALEAWLYHLDSRHSMLRYLEPLLQEFENLTQLAAAVSPIPVGMSIVKAIEPSLFEVLGMQSMGHKLLFARGLMVLASDSHALLTAPATSTEPEQASKAATTDPYLEALEHQAWPNQSGNAFAE